MNSDNNILKYVPNWIKINMKFIIFIAVFVAGFLSCNMQLLYLNNNQLSKITKKLNRNELESLIGDKPKHITAFSYNDKKFDVIVYSYLMGKTRTQTSFSGLSENSYKIGKYVFLFENERLRYWGLPTDFSKSGEDELEILTDSLIRFTKGLPNTSFYAPW